MRGILAETRENVLETSQFHVSVNVIGRNYCGNTSLRVGNRCFQVIFIVKKNAFHHLGVVFSPSIYKTHFPLTLKKIPKQSSQVFFFCFYSPCFLNWQSRLLIVFIHYNKVEYDLSGECTLQSWVGLLLTATNVLTTRWSSFSWALSKHQFLSTVPLSTILTCTIKYHLLIWPFYFRIILYYCVRKYSYSSYMVA